MSLRETIARHAKDVINRADHFGESVTYVPQSGPSVALRVVIDRQNVEPMEGSTRVARLSAFVFLPTSDLPAYPQPGDRLTMVMTLGEAATTCRITNVIDEDEGGVMCEVQA